MRARVDDESIRKLVHTFYGAIQRDDVLGPFFARHIDEPQWPAHLAKMCAFWSTALLATGRYRGNPMVVHAALPDLAVEHFERWLELFESTATEIFAPAVAQAIVSRAQRMGARLAELAAS